MNKQTAENKYVDTDSSYLNHWVRIAELLSVYGDLLPERMQTMLLSYYSDDMSLSEIAEQADVSRQAVHDSLKRGEEHLERYEASLKLVAQRHQLQRAKERLNRKIQELPLSNHPLMDEIKDVIQTHLTELETILTEGSP